MTRSIPNKMEEEKEKVMNLKRKMKNMRKKRTTRKMKTRSTYSTRMGMRSSRWGRPHFTQVIIH